MQKIILATTSPYRIAAFKMLGIDFEACDSEVDERFSGRPDNPRGLVQELSKRKARAVAEKYSEGIIIGFDSIGWFQDNILEKTKNKEEARKRLLEMSGKDFQFLTGVCLINLENNKEYEEVATTKASMRQLKADEVERYLDEDQNFNTYALGFDPLGHSSIAFIKGIEGSYNNILRGIPLELIAEMINEVSED